MDGATALFRFSAHRVCGVVGGRIGIVEVSAWVGMEISIVQILVVVAIIWMKNSKAGEEKGSSV